VGDGKRVVALSSGTAAVHLGLLAAGVGRGDEVIVQSFTFCASAHPVTYLGATPVLEARQVWKPMHKQPVYLRTIEHGTLSIEHLPSGVVCQTSDTSVAYINGVSETLFKVGMCLPTGPCVSDDDVKYIVATIKENIL